MLIEEQKKIPAIKSARGFILNLGSIDDTLGWLKLFNYTLSFLYVLDIDDQPRVGNILLVV